jgi:hypothetical protein
MNPLSIISGLFGGNAVKDAGKALDDIFTSDEEKRAIELEAKKADLNYRLEQNKLDASLALGQLEINKEEAKSPHLFVAGWRPAVGWICAAALGYQFLAFPMLSWASENFGWKVPPALDVQTLMTVLMAMLGMAGFRTFEKVKEVDTTGVRAGAKK